MLQFIRNMPIFRRLFIAFVLATLIPSIVVVLSGDTIAALLLTILIIVGTGYLVDLTITRPLNQLVLLTKRIANGETDARAEVKTHDEIGAVASSINNILENIIHIDQEEQERHESLQLQIDQLVNEVSGLGAGDLTIEAEVTMDELGVLAESFNYMAQELSDLVIRVKILAEEVGTATRKNFERMTQLVQISSLQNQLIVAATTKVGNMTTSSKNVVHRAQLLSDIASNARYTTQSGRDAVQQTISSIEIIRNNIRLNSEKAQILGERLHEIDDIVKVISSIANQTSRLALDAAIQATMAGENGHGFVAIATDIRSLSECSKEQALMIDQIVHTVLEDISSAAHSMTDTERETVTGSRLINEAGQALDSVFSLVEQQANEITTINQVATRQLEASNAIVHIMQKVSDSTRQSNTTIRETSRLMERVALLAKQLHDSVHVFKVREDRVQQITSGTLYAISEELRSDHPGLDSSQRANLGLTTRPLSYDLLLPTDDPSLSYPPPTQPQE